MKSGYENPQAQKLKCPKGTAGAKQARSDRACKEASRDLPACPAGSSSPFCQPAQHSQGCCWPVRWEFTDGYREPGRNLQGWWPLQQKIKVQAGGWEHSTKVLLADLDCPLHKPRVLKIWEMIMWFQSNKGLETKAVRSAACQLHYLFCQSGSTAQPQALLSWVTSRPGKPRHQLPISQEKAEGALAALLQFIASQHKAGRCCRRWTDAGCCSEYSAATDSKRKKKAQGCCRECSAQTLTIKWSPTGQVRKDSYFWNPVQDIEHPWQELSTSQRTE